MEKHWLVLFILVAFRLATASEIGDDKKESQPQTTDESGIGKVTEDGTAEKNSSYVPGTEPANTPSSPIYLWKAPSSIKTAQLAQQVQVPEISTEFPAPQAPIKQLVAEITDAPTTVEDLPTTSESIAEESLQKPVPNIKQYKASSIKTAPPVPQRTKVPEASNEVDSKIKTQFQNDLSEEERLQRADQALNQFFQDVLQNLSVKMKTGMDEPAGEILDPVRLDDMQLQPLVAGEVFDVKMKRISLSGLSDYRVTQLESQLSESRIKVGLHYSKLYANCLFSANGTMYEIFKVTGKGNATLIFNEVHARTVLYVTRDNGTLQVASADQPYVDFSSAEILFREEGAVEGSEPIKAESVATQLGPLYFWVLTANAVEKIDYPLAEYFNKAFKEFPLSDFLQGYAFRQRYLRIHVPNGPIPYAYVSPDHAPL